VIGICYTLYHWRQYGFFVLWSHSSRY